jgi:homoisocitrate dehydrogenase
MFKTAVRSMATSSRKSLTIGLIPADGIGREVIPVCAISNSVISQLQFLQAARDAIIAVKSELPELKFIDLLAGWETFTRTGTALPRETVQ